MSHEFWLQKKAFNSWSHVTWYATEEEVIQNFNRVAVEGNGYSWRWVKVEVGGEYILSGERPVMKAEVEEDNDIPTGPRLSSRQIAGIDPIKPNGGWANSNGGWATNEVAANILKSDHGMVGKVWLGNPVTKEKKRVDPSMVDAMLASGQWVKAGPRTVL